MWRYIRIYRVLIRCNALILMMYRTNLVNDIFSSILWGMFLFVTVGLLTSRSQSVYGVTVPEVLLLSAAYNTLIGVFHCMFSGNFEKLSRVIRYGELDSVLLKPIDSHFFVTMRYVQLTSLIRVCLGIGTIVYLLSVLHIQVSLIMAILFGILLVFGIILLYSLWSFMTTLLIWFPRMQNIVDLMFSVGGLSRYPKGMFEQFGTGFFLLFFPLTLIILIPIGVLLHEANVLTVLTLIIVSMSFFICSHLFWNFALRSYASASS